MGSTMWIAIGAIAVCAIVGDTIVSILKNSGAGKKFDARVADLEAQTDELEADLANARKRIEVLETIVTDQKYDLGRKIDDLAAQ